MRLAKLTGLEIEKLDAELKEVRATIKELKGILAFQAQADGHPEGGDGGGRRARSETTAGPRSWPTRASSRWKT